MLAGFIEENYILVVCRLCGAKWFYLKQYAKEFDAEHPLENCPFCKRNLKGEEPMAKVYGTSEFTREQEEQIDKVIDAAAALIDVLLVKPEYLKDSNLKGIGENWSAIHPAQIADVVANYLVHRCTTNIFYPTHVETDDEEHVSDVFNDEEVYER